MIQGENKVNVIPDILRWIMVEISAIEASRLLGNHHLTVNRPHCRNKLSKFENDEF